MPSGFRSGGVDFDDLFDPYVTGTPPAATGYRIAGVGDLAGRYAPLIYGTQRADVGYRIAGGDDVATLWAAKGTATYVSPTAGLPPEIYSLAAGTVGPLTAVATFTLFRSGASTWNPGGSSAWYPSAPPGIGDLYEVRFEVISGAGGTLSGAALNTWLSLSADRSVTLTRTSSSAATANRVIRTQIRRAGTVTVLGTQDTDMICEVVIA